MKKNQRNKKSKTTKVKDKLKVAFYWAASCGGCEIAILDIDEMLLDVVEHIDVVFWPVALDTKYQDVESLPDKSLDACFFNGAIRTSEQEHMAKLLRSKSKILASFGACSVSGGVPGLANLSDRNSIIEEVYIHNNSTANPDRVTPRTRSKVKEGELFLPELYDTVKSLAQVVEVDYYIPGCPPSPGLIINALNMMISGKLPCRGAVLAPDTAVCEECRYEKSEKKIRCIKRIYELEEVEDKCFLEQGVICLGPVTRGGCEGRCMKGNMPCTGCGGLLPRLQDQGAGMISALASILGVEEEEKLSEEDVNRLIDQIKDTVGTFYKYTLPVSIINRKIKRGVE
ncbi:MAG: oxidoreductase [Candidatus Thermoplasmatota archaeon]